MKQFGYQVRAMWAGVRAHHRCHMAQERNDLEIARLYFNVAIECFNKAALEEHADGAQVFRRMGRRYIPRLSFTTQCLNRNWRGGLHCLNSGGA